MTVRIRRDLGRPTKVEEAMRVWAVNFVELLQSALKSSERYATGNLDSSFVVVISKPQEVNIEAADYARYAISGRGPTPPGTPPSSPTLREALKPWIRIKIGAGSERELNSIAYLIARKIHREGYEPGLAQGELDMLLDISFEQSRARIGDEFLEKASDDLDRIIRKNFENSRIAET